MRIISVVSAIAAISAGIIVMLGYFVPIAPFPDLRNLLVEWATILGGMAVLIGILNLISVQLERISKREKGSLYGIVLILSLGVTFVLGVIRIPGFPLIEGMVNSLAVGAIIQPVEAALLALLTVTLVSAGIRILRRRVDVMSVVFLLAALIVMVAAMPTPFGPIPLLSSVYDFSIGALIGKVLAAGGARGLLIGISLGTLLTGLRVLFGVDRPYGGN